jgi:hypothetical protein
MVCACNCSILFALTSTFCQVAIFEALISIFWSFSPGHFGGNMNSNICIMQNMTQSEQFALSALFIVAFILVLCAVTCRSIWRVSLLMLRPVFVCLNVLPFVRFDTDLAALECSTALLSARPHKSQMQNTSRSGDAAQPVVSVECDAEPADTENLRASRASESRSFPGRAGASWLVLLISLYNSALTLAVKSITCIHLQDFDSTIGDSDTVWYYDGNLKCYTSWQVGCFILLSAILALPLCIYFGASRMLAARPDEIAISSAWRRGALQYYTAAFKKSGFAAHWMTVMFMQRSLMMMLTIIPFSPRSQ